MVNLLKKISNNNNTMYHLGYISYGTSIIIVSIMVLIVTCLDIYKDNNIYLNKVLHQKESVAEEFLDNDNPKIINYNLTVNSEVQLNDRDFTTNDLKKIFEEQKYYISSVRDERFVPNISINRFPKDFNLIGSTKEKKSLFIRSLLPLIILENNKIINTNKKIKKINNNIFDYITRDDALWLKKQYLNYKVKSHRVDELLIKVDIIPVSIALAQAAIESGWGTSRFATEGNALFGQWSWFKGSGIVPKKRDLDKSYEIKSFDNLRQSVAAYMKNLNSHNNYSEFRAIRNDYRINKDEINSINLLIFLSDYAENSEYSKILEKIIKKNNLQEFDQAEIYILPYEVANLISN
ncbi:glucosaminidase domain-containing protein [Pelagibacteraceae bacterium]|nr:glucosaminidase domain-containing protein [Pelagibacteraceae bacterium]